MLRKGPIAACPNFSGPRITRSRSSTTKHLLSSPISMLFSFTFWILERHLPLSRWIFHYGFHGGLGVRSSRTLRRSSPSLPCCQRRRWARHYKGPILKLVIIYRCSWWLCNCWKFKCLVDLEEMDETKATSKLK